MDINIANLAPDIAKILGIPPSTMLLLLFVISSASNVTARLIPDTATDWKGTVRKIASVIGAYVPSRVAPGVSVADVAKAALQTPPITQKVESELAEDPDYQAVRRTIDLVRPERQPVPEEYKDRG